MLTCRQFDSFMVDYLDRTLPVTQQLSCWLHVTMCRGCRKYVQQYRRTIELGKSAFDEPDGPVPGSVPDALVAAALAHRRKTDSSE